MQRQRWSQWQHPHLQKNALRKGSPSKNESGAAPTLYVQNGNKSGSELDDWLQAEEELRRAAEEAIDKR
ncbi:MAG: hypothetical protein DMG57_41485 [Acidobacteria bacterium]|nr:MAG: hypothetical protein DMG57_41485 [Acidobacteriota bacterium]